MKIEKMKKELILLSKEEFLSAKSVKALHEISLLIKKRVSALDQKLYNSPESLLEWIDDSEKCELLAEFLCLYRNAYANIQRIIQRKQKEQQFLHWLEEEEEEQCCDCRIFSLPKSVRGTILFEF